MRTLGIGEVARLVGVRPHVIRYWESELPLLAPRKGKTGRREYTQRELSLLLRLKRLLHERRYTLEGARRRIWEDLAPERLDLRARFDAIRAELSEALMLIQDRRGTTVSERDLRKSFGELGHVRLFDHWESRTEAMRRRLIEDLEELDRGTLERLRRKLAEGSAHRAAIEPVPYARRGEIAADREAPGIGAELIRKGATAVLTVAGGQGTRLGFDGPKGLFPVTPIRRLTLFALFAEKLAAARRRWGAAIPWLIMTSLQNDRQIRAYFEREGFFGLGGDTVRFFSQGMLPALSPEGELLLAPEGGLAQSPNGHGGAIESLRSSGLLNELASRGIEELSYCQVDNPIATVPDPVFLGFHRRARADISSKVVQKAFPEEKIGTIGRVDGRPAVIEYSDLPPEILHATNGEGRPRFAHGSIAIHILRVGFLARSDLRLPYHLARKKVRALKPGPGGADIEEREAVKFEMFVFDAIPFAERALFFEVDRAEEFAPLKNREGVDSIETCTQGQVEKAARWLESCGVVVPRGPEGRPRHLIELSPLFSLDREELAAKRPSLPDRIDAPTLLA